MVKETKQTLFSETEKRIIYELGGDIGESDRPFAELAEKIGISEDEAIEIIWSLNERGLMRRFGATLRHQKSGFTANAMAAWKVPSELSAEVGAKLAEFPEVSHCYERRTYPEWPYNLYTMIHAENKEQIHETVLRMSKSVGIDEYHLLFSVEELKKTSMRYFS